VLLSPQERECLAGHRFSVICVLFTAPAPIGKTKKRLTTAANAWRGQNHWAVLTGLAKVFQPVQRTFKFMWLDTIKYAKANPGSAFPVPLARMSFSERNTTKDAAFPHGCPFLWVLDTHEVEAGVRVLPDFFNVSESGKDSARSTGSYIWSEQEAMANATNVRFIEDWLEKTDRTPAERRRGAIPTGPIERFWGEAAISPSKKEKAAPNKETEEEWDSEL
jgi:hypothetical protein